MSHYQSLKAALNPSMRKKIVGFFMIVLAFFWLIFKSTHGGIVLFDVFYSLTFFCLGLITNIEGRGYYIFRKPYVLIEEDRFEIKTDVVTYSIAWDNVDKIDFLSSAIIVVLKDGEEQQVPLAHLNPHCVVYLRELFSDVTFENHVNITFYA